MRRSPLRQAHGISPTGTGLGDGASPWVAVPQGLARVQAHSCISPARTGLGAPARVAVPQGLARVEAHGCISPAWTGLGHGAFPWVSVPHALALVEARSGAHASVVGGEALAW